MFFWRGCAPDFSVTEICPLSRAVKVDSKLHFFAGEGWGEGKSTMLS